MYHADGGDAERWVLKNPELHAHGEMRRRHIPVKQIEVLGIAAGLAVAVVVVGAVALTGLILGAVAVGRGTSSSSTVDLPSNLARLTDPGAETSGLVVQNGTELTVVPIMVDNTTISFTVEGVGAGAATAKNGTNQVRGLRANGTLDLSYTVVGDDVLLTGNLPAGVAKLCGTSCTGNDVLVVAPNGTCLQCSTGVRAASFMRTCGTCPPFASVRLAANSSCYECLSIPASSVFNGGGDVGVQLGSNDTLVYSTLKTFMADPTVSSSGSSSYTYTSGWYKTTTFPVDYPGNSHGLTLYQIDIGMNILLSFTGSPGSQIAIVYDFSSIVPGWVISSDPSKKTVSGSVSCWGIPVPTSAWVVFADTTWTPYAIISADVTMSSGYCVLDYSVFWTNG